MRSTGLLLASLVLLPGCRREEPLPPPPSGRCEVDLQATGLFRWEGRGAKAHRLASASDGIGGEMSAGRAGDVLLQNEKIRVVVQQPGRGIAHVPFGGSLIDADLTRERGEAGADQLGRLGAFYAFGRAIEAEEVAVLSDGSQGGPAIVAVSGKDALNDFAYVSSNLEFVDVGISLVLDEEKPIPVRGTTYYVLSPGESRVRILTAFCNQSETPVQFPVGDLVEQGGSTDFLNPMGCTKTLGNKGCLVDTATWFGYQGNKVAYGYRGYRLADPKIPDPGFSLLELSGTVATLPEGGGLAGALSYVDKTAPKRPGTLAIRMGEPKTFLRDWVVARDLAAVSAEFLALDQAATGKVKVTVRDAVGPVAGARVSVLKPDNRMVTLGVSDKDGVAVFFLPAAGERHRFNAWTPGRALVAASELDVGAGAQELTLTLGAKRELFVSVRDDANARIPAKVTVMCEGVCPDSSAAQRIYADVETLASNVAAIGFVPPQGELVMALPPARYNVVVTRGPEFTAWPQSWPDAGARVDLTTADGRVDAVVARVVDTHEWLAADFHVHATNSADSALPNQTRVLSFLAEGMDVLVSTDHDVVTDYAPMVRALEAQNFITTVIGSEVSPNFGHHNVYPMVQLPLANGGPYDWPVADAPVDRMEQMYRNIHDRYPDSVIQVNHGRGKQGIFTRLQLDTATGASHADPGPLRMAPHPQATATDAKLFSFDFDAMEVMNGPGGSFALLNDWMTFLSRGTVKAATAVSDTHSAFGSPAGYSRSYIKSSKENVAAVTPKEVADAVRHKRLMGTNGPFLRLFARKVTDAGTPLGDFVSVGDTLQVSAGEEVELMVDVQAPTFITFDRVEVYTHAAGREALNGEDNDGWPSSRIHQARVLDPNALPRELIIGRDAKAYPLVHVRETFRVQPSADTWYAAMVRGTGPSASLYPLIYRAPSCSNGVCTPAVVKSFAYTNAILVDRDGSGAYDNFPLRQGLSVPRPVKARRAPRTDVPSLAEAEEILQRILDHD